MKKSVIHIIQYESKGRHEDPIITFDDDEFLKESLFYSAEDLKIIASIYQEKSSKKSVEILIK